MKQNFFKNIIIFIALILFSTNIVFFGTGLTMMIVDFLPDYFWWFLLGSIGTAANMFWIHLLSNDYKIKYFFLGKNFDQKVEDYFKDTNMPDYAKNALLKSMKRQYRINGEIVSVYIEERDTPFELWGEINREFNYPNALDKQKIDYIIFCMHLNAEDGGGLYRFFEDLSFEPFTYDEVYNLINKTKLVSKEIKKLVLDPKYKNIMELFRLDKLNEEQDKILQDFDENDSDLLCKFSNELKGVVENRAITLYREEKRLSGLPNSTVKVYLSKDGFYRICIYFDKGLNVYRVNKSVFQFYDSDSSLLYSEGGWISEENKSYYETVELAYNDIQSLIKGYKEVKTPTIFK